MILSFPGEGTMTGHRRMEGIMAKGVLPRMLAGEELYRVIAERHYAQSRILRYLGNRPIGLISFVPLNDIAHPLSVPNEHQEQDPLRQRANSPITRTSHMLEQVRHPCGSRGMRAGDRTGIRLGRTCTCLAWYRRPFFPSFTPCHIRQMIIQSICI